MYRAMFALEYYMTNEWNFKNDNSLSLCTRLKPNDKKDFYFNVAGINLEEYFMNGSLAMRRYLLHEKDEDIPKARVHRKR